MFGSSEPNSNVMSLLQCAQLVWEFGLTFWARSRNTWEHFVHLILTLSSIMKCPRKGKSSLAELKRLITRLCQRPHIYSSRWPLVKSPCGNLIATV